MTGEEAAGGPGDRGESSEPAADALAGPGPEDGPGGIFGSWRAVYLTLALYTGLVIVVLLFLTSFLNAGG